MPYSLRIIRIINDTFTVENEYEVEDPQDLVPSLQKSEIGRKMLSLLELSYEGVEPKIPQSVIAEAQSYENQLKEEGRKEVYAEALALGLDLEKILVKKDKEGVKSDESESNIQAET